MFPTAFAFLLSLRFIHAVNVTIYGWTADSSNPVIEQYPLYYYDNATNLNSKAWNDPCVLPFNGTHYRMYLTKNSNPLYFDGSYVLPYIAYSTDGINWDIDESQPLLQNGASGSYDDKGVETPNVVFFQNTYHMFYTATKFGDGYKFRIGHATSANGVDNWVKDPNNPIIVPSSDTAAFDYVLVGEPAAVVFNSSIYLYVTAGGLANDLGSKTVIGLSISADGVNFSPLTQVAAQDETIYPRTSNYTGYSTPTAVVIDGEVHIFHDVAQQILDFTQVALHHIKSADGKTNWVQDTMSIFTRSDFFWTQNEIRSPSVVVEDDTVKMWFAGHTIDFNNLTACHMGIGYATATLETGDGGSSSRGARKMLLHAVLSLSLCVFTGVN